MKCKVDGCDRDTDYDEQQVCQKHYFRFMRNGYYDLKRDREQIIHGKRPKKYRYQNPAGYELIDEPQHILSGKNGYVYEHRFVYYNDVDSNPSECSLCGDSITWQSLHIDHIDEDVSNNNKENLRALCRPCNVFRGHDSESMGKYTIEIDGKIMSPFAWARKPGVVVTGSTILRRKKSGMSDYDSVYAPRITHNNTKSVTGKSKKKYDDIRGI